MRLRGRRREEPSEELRKLLEVSDEERAEMEQLADTSVPLPPGAEQELTRDNPRLQELRAAYAALDLPVLEPSRWHDEAVENFLDLRYFRGESLITWHYRELPRITRLKYYAWLRHLEDRDERGLLGTLGEDGAFGCWTYDYEGHPLVSRDLMDSVNELCFLEEQLALSQRERFSVLDVGAGFGRLAHRMAGAYPNLADYCCVDAIPDSTFVCEYYLRHRAVAPPARVVGLHELDGALTPGSFDLAVNIHSFSECPLAAIAWWLERLAELEVPRLLIVPNEPTELLSLETDRSRRDFAPLLDQHGYRLAHREPVIADPAVRELVRTDDHFHLFERR